MTRIINVGLESKYYFTLYFTIPANIQLDSLVILDPLHPIFLDDSIVIGDPVPNVMVSYQELYGHEIINALSEGERNHFVTSYVEAPMVFDPDTMTKAVKVEFTSDGLRYINQDAASGDLRLKVDFPVKILNPTVLETFNNLEDIQELENIAVATSVQGGVESSAEIYLFLKVVPYQPVIMPVLATIPNKTDTKVSLVASFPCNDSNLADSMNSRNPADPANYIISFDLSHDKFEVPTLPVDIRDFEDIKIYIQTDEFGDDGIERPVYYDFTVEIVNTTTVQITIYQTLAYTARTLYVVFTTKLKAPITEDELTVPYILTPIKITSLNRENENIHLTHVTTPPPVIIVPSSV